MSDNSSSRDNVIAFRKPKSVKRSAATRDEGVARHERVIRLRLRGQVRDKALIAWLIEESVMRKIDGWSRLSSKDGALDVLLAGAGNEINTLVDMIRHGPRPVDILGVDEGVVRGDEPIWTGFHNLPSI